jgi:mannose-1-phosphate guanylyltransferase
MAVERLDGLLETDHILVVTIQSQVDMLHEQVPSIPMENYLIEPMPKGTAAVVGFAAEYLRKRNPDAVMAVLTADHVMENIEYFKELLTRAGDIAHTGTLVTIGIKPEFASTGFGYIQTGEKRNGIDAFAVEQFVEKPDEETAEAYINSGDYFWNSGMFIWSVESILKEFKRQMPNLYKQITQVSNEISSDGRVGDINDIWREIDPETIDYGIMEGARDVTLIPAIDLGWKDLGSWDSLFSILKPDERGNIELAPRVLNVNSSDCFIQTTNSEKAIAVIGVEDLIIVDHENTLLICKKGDSQDVKQIVQSLKDEKLEQYL